MLLYKEADRTLLHITLSSLKHNFEHWSWINRLQ